MNQVSNSPSGSKHPSLKPKVLNFVELLAQNIAMISPTMTAALIVPLMFSNSGNMSWLSYAVATVMLLFVAYNLNQFAKRGAGTGSMYSYTCSGLGAGPGSMCGWCLVWAYLFIGIAGTSGFTIFADKLLQMMHINAPPVLLFAVCVGGCFYISYQDIKISTLVSLVLEGISVLFILMLAFIVLGKTQFTPDPAQFAFKSVTLSSLGLGVVVAIFSLVGFESSTAFGDEAINPLKTIPRSIIWSLITTGLFFVFITYVEVLGTHGYSKTLDQLDAPLNTLAERFGVSAFAPVVSAGAMLSFFALALACLNSGARVMFAMGRHDFFPRSTSAVHKVHETPHVALAVMGVLMFGIAAVCKMKNFGMEVLDIFNDAGTMGAFGFLGAYFLVTIAAPVFLKKRGMMKAKDVVFCVAGVLLMCIPAVGSVYPVPAPPQKYYPYVFLGYLTVGVLRLVLMYIAKPERHQEINAETARAFSQA
ncbi:MAG TPA: APC family permease [Opitutaceae bacterium]|nr:APC family permease [Opitutaceae bacterium]